MLKSWELPQFSTDFENTAKKINKMHSGHQFDDVITCIFILLFNTWFSSLKKTNINRYKKKVLCTVNQNIGRNNMLKLKNSPL